MSAFEGKADIDPTAAHQPRFLSTSFEQIAYGLGWVILDFDWPTWKQTPEAISLRDDDQALAQATPEQLARLLTVCIRQDRFCEDALESAFESELLTRILERAAAILRQLEPQACSARSRRRDKKRKTRTCAS